MTSNDITFGGSQMVSIMANPKKLVPGSTPSILYEISLFKFVNIKPSNIQHGKTGMWYK